MIPFADMRFTGLADENPFGKTASPIARFNYPGSSPIGFCLLSNRGACLTRTTGGVDFEPGRGPGMWQTWTRQFWFAHALDRNEIDRLVADSPALYAQRMLDVVLSLATPVPLQVARGTVAELRERLQAACDLLDSHIVLHPTLGETGVRIERDGRSQKVTFLKHLANWHQPRWTKAAVEGSSGFLRQFSEPLRMVPASGEPSAHELLERHHTAEALYESAGDFFSRDARARGIASIT